MATTTTYYGFDIPQSSDLVKDGATAIATLGQDIDTAMNTALGTKKSGLVLLNTTSFSAVSQQIVPNVFSTTYRNYKAIINVDSSTSTGHGNLQFRFGTSGTPNTATNYNNRGFYIDATINTLDATGAGKISFGYAQFSPTANTASKISTIEIMNPFESLPTYAFAQGTDTSYRVNYADVLFDLTTSFTDFVIFPNSNAITGTISIFGYNK